MRIAYVHYLQHADTARNHADQFAAAARALEHDVTIHAMNFAPNADAVISRRLRMRRALKKRLRRYLHEPKEIYWNLAYVRKETALLRPLRPDVLLVRDHFLTASCVPVAHRLRCPLVLEINAPAEEAHLYQDEYWHVPAAAAWLQRWKLRHADAATVVSSALRDYLVQRYAVPPQKLTVVPNGADTDLFRPHIEPDPSVRVWARDSTVIGFVGSFHKWHGASVLVDMMRIVMHVRPHTSFIVVGEGPEATLVKNAVATHAGRALFLGRLPYTRVPAVVASFDIGVMPQSNFYGSPLKVIEWMAAGKAIVAPDYGPLRDIIDHGVHALLFPPGNLDALVSAVLRLVDDADLRRSLGAAASARAHASLSWFDNARRVLAACERTCQFRRGGTSTASLSQLESEELAIKASVGRRPT